MSAGLPPPDAPARLDAGGPLNLLAQGWRFIPHSYALVHQWQLLSLARRPDVSVRIVDAPHPRHWRAQPGLFDPPDERALTDLSPPTPEWAADATLRVTFPLDFRPAAGHVMAVFGTSEYRVVPPASLADRGATRRARGNPRVLVVTPSRWSAAGFARLGFPEARIAVIPHGVRTELFRPDPAARAAVRARLGLDGFTFLNVGAMTRNKGIDLLLRAFAEIAATDPRVRLLLKGSDDLYTSSASVQKSLRGLSVSQTRQVTDRLVYTGSTLSMREMAGIYAAADAYVAPYRAEGFNLPVLEAMACGLPVVCTAGGPTDDFITPAAARTIQSRTALTITLRRRTIGRFLRPSLDHLLELMRAVMSDAEWRRRAAVEGPAHVAAAFTWDHAAARLTSALRAAAGRAA